MDGRTPGAGAGNPLVLAQLNENPALVDFMADKLYARLQIPLRSKWDLKRAAGVIRALAASIEALGDRTDISQVQALFDTWVEVQSVNQKLRPRHKPK